MGIEKLTKYNFCKRVYKNNGMVFYDILTNEIISDIDEEGFEKFDVNSNDKGVKTNLVSLSEEQVYKVLSGRKYKIVNLKIENNKIILKDTSEDLDLVKNICCPIQLFDEMEQPFQDNQIKFMEKKLKYILRQLFSKYRNEISVPKKYIVSDNDYGVTCYLTLISKKKERFKYQFALFINYDSNTTIDYVSWNDEVLGTAAYGHIHDWNTKDLGVYLENVIVGTIQGNW